MTTAILFILFVLGCVLAPITGVDSRPREVERWWPASPR
jgi:hypothetical protein